VVTWGYGQVTAPKTVGSPTSLVLDQCVPAHPTLSRSRTQVGGWPA